MRLLKHLLNSAFKLIPLILITFLYTLYYRILRLRTKKLYRELVASTSKKKASYAKFVSVLKRLPRIALSILGGHLLHYTDPPSTTIPHERVAYAAKYEGGRHCTLNTQLIQM
jgi:hypothetical protein